MKLPRDLGGAELVRTLCRDFNYVKLGQEGSHVILRTEAPRGHRISVPNHNPLRLGTLNAILKAVARAKDLSIEDLLEALQ